jgi:hypothetical protein
MEYEWREYSCAYEAAGTTESRCLEIDTRYQCINMLGLLLNATFLEMTE